MNSTEPRSMESVMIEDELVLTDVCSQTNQEIRYIKTRDADLIKVETVFSTNWFFSLKATLKDVFLPKGYPKSVSNDYLEYQIWDTLQTFCSSISGSLTVRAILQGIGVGSETANSTSAAIAWLLKDGTGMIGSILFTWVKGSYLDADCKKWRLFADVLNDIAMFIELYIPLYIQHAEKLLCLATVFKALVGTAGSSTRAALITHQAITGNVADVSAKDGSQEICTNLCAFVLSIFILKYVTKTDQIWTIMCTAVFFHLYFNYKAVKCLKLKVFNRERFRMGVKSYFISSVFPTVEQINRRESVFFLIRTYDYDICGFSVEFGKCAKSIISTYSPIQFNTLITLFQDKKYLIIIDTTGMVMYVTFRKLFQDSDVIKAYFHSMLLGIAYSYLKKNKKSLVVTSKCRKNSPVFRLKTILNEFLALHTEVQQNEHELEETIIIKSYMSCEDIIENEFSMFSECVLEQGWTLEKNLINTGYWRGVWKLVEEKKEISLKRLITKKHTHHHAKRRSKHMQHGWGNLIIS